jgi:Phage capsid family
VAVGTARQGYDLQLTRYDARGWPATFYTTGMSTHPRVRRAPDGSARRGTRRATGERTVSRRSRSAASCVSVAPVIALWGLPLVVSAALAAGTGVVGAFRRGGAIYRKRTYRVDMSNSHSDFFIKNLVAIRAEVRELLAVFKPESFASVTNLGVVA